MGRAEEMCRPQIGTIGFTGSILNMATSCSQDRDLERLRRKWLYALTKRQEYLDQQLQKLVGKPGKQNTLKGDNSYS